MIKNKSSINQINNKSFIYKEFCDVLSGLLKNKLSQQQQLKGISQNTTGRIWTSLMWHSLTLKVVYEVFNDKINKYCIENKKFPNCYQY